MELTNLRELYMDDNHVRYINPAWFASLSNLIELRIHRNNLHFIPDRAFEPLTNLETLVIGDNTLRFVGSEAFGNNTLSALKWLSVVNSEIHGFDVEIFNRASALEMLYLFGNPCVNLNFYNVNTERDLVREQLTECFDSFAGSLHCDFIQITSEYF
jgi:Leucine-rich repeat (LRR) protein